MSNVGRRNVYLCTSGHRLVTVDRDEGLPAYVTPCKHPGCFKLATSSFYTGVAANDRPTHEWYRKTDDEARSLTLVSQDHHRMGGLFLRELTKST